MIACDNDRIVHESPTPALISRHPRVPSVEVMCGPRSGCCYLVAFGADMTGEQLADVGEWLAERGREQADMRRR